MEQTFAWAFPLFNTQTFELTPEHLIALDASVLLDMHRVDSASLREIRKALEAVKEQLWLPYQAADEYIRHTIGVADKARHIFAQYVSDLKSAVGTLEKELANISSRHPTINSEILGCVSDIQARTEAIFQEKYETLPSRAQTAAQTHSDVRKATFALFEGKVGPQYEKHVLEEKYREAEDRFKKRIPPGYEDQDKDGLKKYGDYLVWSQLMDKARETKWDVVFLTQEKKGDWFEHLSQGQLSPRLELTREAYEKTEGQCIYIMRLDYFLKKYGFSQRGEGLTSLQSQSIDEISKLSEERQITRNRRHLPLVREIEQSIRFGNDEMEKGSLRFILARDTTYFSITGYRENKMMQPEAVKALIASSPEPLADSPRMTYGFGHEDAFHLHFQAAAGTQFPTGEYEVHYRITFEEKR